jgi:hypothetical protein
MIALMVIALIMTLPALSSAMMIGHAGATRGGATGPGSSLKSVPGHSDWADTQGLSTPEQADKVSEWATQNKEFLRTLNQRVQGSSPCAPTKNLHFYYDKSP